MPKEKSLLEDVKERFEGIYKAIAKIEGNIDEDDVLRYTIKRHFDSLTEDNAYAKILILAKDIQFIKDFCRELTDSFTYLMRFSAPDQEGVFSIHALISLGDISFAFPFIIKAYRFGLNNETKGRLCASLKSMLIRDRLIGTRADINSRFNDVFRGFTMANSSIDPIVGRVNELKVTEDWWSAYWNNVQLDRSLQGPIKHPIARFILWKYENHLKANLIFDQDGYPNKQLRFNDIVDQELEHIAPQTEPVNKPHGYGVYDEEFKQKDIDCLGNYLSMSKSHNCAVGNVPFRDKYKTYNNLEQQKEIKMFANYSEIGPWNREIIRRRKAVIIDFVKNTF